MEFFQRGWYKLAGIDGAFLIHMYLTGAGLVSVMADEM
jgi:hypothetical protein